MERLTFYPPSSQSARYPLQTSSSHPPIHHPPTQQTSPPHPHPPLQDGSVQLTTSITCPAVGCVYPILKRNRSGCIKKNHVSKLFHPHTTHTPKKKKGSTYPLAPSNPHHLRRLLARRNPRRRDAQQLQLLRLRHRRLQSHIRERRRAPRRIPEPRRRLDRPLRVPLRGNRHVQPVGVVAWVARRGSGRRRG